MSRSPKSDGIHTRSGSFQSRDPYIHLLYHLLRDVSPSGTIEEIMNEVEECAGQNNSFTNGWTALHAQDIVKRLDAIRVDSAEVLSDAAD
jgi:hypothetical protein